MAKTPRKKQQTETTEQTQPAVETATTGLSFNDGVVKVPSGSELAEALKNHPMNIDNNDPGHQSNTQTITIPPVTQELVTARFKTELSRLKYQEALQSLTSYRITEANMAEAQKKLSAARSFLRRMDDIKANGKAPALAECRFWDAAFLSLKTPLETEIQKKQKELNDIAAEQARKQEEILRENRRVEGIKKDMDDTLMEHSQAIAAATKTDTLIVLEKLLGSQKANKARFMEFLPEFVQRAGELTPLIKQQKEAIKELEEIERKKKEAEATGDDAAFIALEEQKEQVTARIEETQVVVQERAINQATAVSTSVEVGRQIFSTVKARRSVWKAELPTSQKDLEKAFKAGLLSFELDKDKIKTLIATLEDTGQLKDKEETTVNGVRLYLEKLY